jgi:hypothetical protein
MFQNEDEVMQPEFEGCGILFHHLDYYFILSVQHIFEDAYSIPKYVYIPFKNEMINFSYKLLADKKIDIAIAIIEPNDVYKFSNYQPIKITDIAYFVEDEAKGVFLSGFPSAGIEFSPALSKLGYTYYSGWLPINQNKMEQNKIHSTVFINYPPDWNKKQLYNPTGMSGSGVWINDNNGLPKLFGINYYFDGIDCIHAHRIHLYIEYIKQKFDNTISIPKITKVKLL